jgi:hypothetical protein
VDIARALGMPIALQATGDGVSTLADVAVLASESGT